MKFNVLFLLVFGLLTLGCTGTTPQTDNRAKAQNISDKCLSLPAADIKNYVFKEADHDCYGEKYILPAYFGNLNYTGCDEIIDEDYRGACYGAFGAFQNDSTRCSEFQDNMARSMCMYTYAMHVADPDSCDGIPNDAFKEKCKKDIG